MRFGEGSAHRGDGRLEPGLAQGDRIGVAPLSTITARSCSRSPRVRVKPVEKVALPEGHRGELTYFARSGSSS